jgi:hypothetical protein
MAYDRTDTPFTQPPTTLQVYRRFDSSFYTDVPLTFAIAREAQTIIVTFERALRSLPATTVIGNYSLTGSSVLTITSISFTPGTNVVTLHFSGTVVTGTYTLQLATRTTQALGDDLYNVTTPASLSTSVVSTALNVLSATAATKQVTINLNTNAVLIGNALDRSQYLITGASQNILINSISTGTNSIVLSTTEMSQGTTYTLTMPTIGIINQLDGSACIGPFTTTFSGVGSNPTILIIKSIDEHTIQIVFSEPVNTHDALNINNYAADNGLTITGASKISSTIFNLTTSKQAVGTVYQVTGSNIRDIDGNSM